MTGRWPVALALMAALIGAAPQGSGYVTTDGRFRVVGYNDMDEMLGDAARRIAASGSAVRFELDLKATRSAPAALIAGTSLVAPMGAAMEPADRVAFRAAWGSDPVEFRIAHDSLKPGTLSSPTAILVAADNPLRRITLAQARRLFAADPGERPITRWGDLGLGGRWRTRPIRMVALAADTAIGRFALSGPLRASVFAASVEAKRQSRDVAAAVASDNAAIGLANANFAGPRLRALPVTDDQGRTIAPTRDGIRSGHYPFDRFLLIYARREADGAIAPAASLLLESLLSPAGQAAIGRQSRGFLPLNHHELAVERERLKKNVRSQ